MRPGSWFSAMTVLDGAGCEYDAHARGSTTVLMLAQADLRAILQEHEELYAALLRLHARRTRQVFELIEDMMCLPLRARLAKQLLRLSAGYGVPAAGSIRIGLQLTQEDIAQLLGASRQRVSSEINALRRSGVLKMEHGRLLVCDRAALQRIAEGAEEDPADRYSPAAPGSLPESAAPLLAELLAA
jgi:CRP-like cAMP-binding protein